MVDLRKNVHLLDNKDCVVYAHMSGNKVQLSQLFPLVEKMYSYAVSSFLLLMFTLWVVCLSIALAWGSRGDDTVSWWFEPSSFMIAGAILVFVGLVMMVRFLALCGRTFSYYLSPNWTSLLPPKITICMIKGMRKSLAERVNMHWSWLPMLLGLGFMLLGALLVDSVPAALSVLAVTPLLYVTFRVKKNCERGRLLLSRKLGFTQELPR